MSRKFEEAMAEVRLRRQKLLATLDEVQARTAPAQIAEDVLTALDPQRNFLKRLRDWTARNRLLSLATVAGAGWLTGLSRHLDGRPSVARKAPRTKPKEKNNDSGQHQRNQRPEPGSGRRKVPRTKGAAQAERLAQLGGKAWRSGGEPQFAQRITEQITVGEGGGVRPQPVEPGGQHHARPQLFGAEL